jgi:hypothetical protein
MTSFFLSLLVAMSASFFVARALGQKFKIVLLVILMIFCVRLMKVKIHFEEEQHKQYLDSLETCCNN